MADKHSIGNKTWAQIASKSMTHASIGLQQNTLTTQLDPPPPATYVDIGVNLGKKDFPDPEVILQDALKHNVTRFIVTGCSVPRSEEAWRFTQRYPRQVYSTAGVHPHNAKSCNAKTLDELRALLKHREVVAVGECGLDYDRNFSPPHVQRRWFEEQLKLAVETQKPVFLHEREAFQDFHRILSKYAGQLKGMCVHCFTGGQRELEAYLALGCYIGITGWVTDDKRGAELQRVIPLIPRERLLIETDAPFLLPKNIPPNLLGSDSSGGRPRNKPKYLPFVAQRIAEIYTRSGDRCSQGDIANITTNTAISLFELDA